MRWSKLRALVISRFAEPLRGRLDIHSAAYGACSCGHAWLALDGNVIANFCTRAYYIAQGMESSGTAPNPMYKSHLTKFGAFSRQDAYRSCWDFVHELSIEQALVSDDLLVQALAVADARVGKRRLAALDPDRHPPLVAYLLTLRMHPRIRLAPDNFISMRSVNQLFESVALQA